MRSYEQIREDYFDWIYKFVTPNDAPTTSFRKLLHTLDDIDFSWTIPEDESRAMNGIEIRWKYAFENDMQDEWDDIKAALEKPCSVLEMIFALAVKMEGIIHDPHKGDRTHQWFWNMVVNMELYGQRDELFDEPLVRKNVARMLNREYKKNGQGGLFWMYWSTYDMPHTDIWTQMCWYLDSTT